MKISLRNLDEQLVCVARLVGEMADQRHERAYVVGGVVRDLILGRKNFDLDIVVEKDAISLARQFAKSHQAKVVEYPPFKTAAVTLKNGFKFDLATARKETYPHPGALPVVKKGSLREDLYRRDFTINAIALVINKKNFGELVDDFGGLKDLKAKRIRVLHEKSFIDDPTRIFRAVRFSSRFNFQIEKKTLLLLKEALEYRFEERVKPQRYFEEFKKILDEQKPKKYIKRLAVLKGLRFLTLEAKFNTAMGRFFDTIDNNIAWFDKTFGRAKDLKRWIVYLMALLRELSFDESKAIMEKFNLSREDRESILLTKSVGKIIESISSPDATPYGVYKTLKPLSDEAVVFCRSCADAPEAIRQIEKFLTTYDNVKLDIDGDDLKCLGIEEGSRIGRILEELLQRKMSGDLGSRSAQLEAARMIKNSLER